MGLFDRSKSVTSNLTEQVNRPVTITDSDYANVLEAGGDIYSVSTDHNAIDRATEIAMRSLLVGESIVADGLRAAEETARLSQTSAVRLGEGAFDLSYESQLLSAQSATRLGEGAFDLSYESQLLAAQGAARAIDSSEYSSQRAIESAEYSAARALNTVEFLSSGALETTSALARDFGTTNYLLAENVQAQAGNFLDTALDFTRGLQTKFQDTIGSTVDAIQRIGVEQNKSTDQRLAETSEKVLKYAVIAIGVMALGLVGFAAFRR